MGKRLEGTSDNFALHVKGAFKTTEDAVNQLKLQGDATRDLVASLKFDGAGGGDNGTAADPLFAQRIVTLSLDMQNMKGKIAQLEGKCHCQHVQAVIDHANNHLDARGMARIGQSTPTGTGASPAPFAVGGGGCGPDSKKGNPGVPGERPQTVGGHSCHCVHVAQLLDRMSTVEALVMNANGDPWQWGQGQRQHGEPGDSGGHRRHDRDGDHDMGLNVRGNNTFFDDKVPMSEEYRTDGGANNIDRWRHKTRGYFIGKVPALLPLLDWAEKREHQAITFEDVIAETANAGTLTPADTRMVNGAVWTFLQMCTTAGASDVINLVPELNGMEAWRPLMVMANRGRNLRLAGLRRAVRKPEAISKLEGVHAGIIQFDSAIKKLNEAGGTPIRAGDEAGPA
jgi:hypothetical protein